jgi:Na+/melibiose symporter-like transporter
MVLAYTTPHFGRTINIVYAFVTNILLMTLYSANNMPYSALGGVMTGDVNERAKLNSFRFISVNAAQFIVGGFTLPLVAKFAGADHNKERGWSVTMSIWAVLCLCLFLITFFSSKERVQPISQNKTPWTQDFADLFKNRPWIIMFFMTLTHFAILSLRGTALYNYYHYYADKGALYDWLNKLGLTTAAGAHSSGILEYLGYIVHGDRANLADSNVADVANSIINMLGTGITMIIILLSPPLARRFGKKAVTVACFGLASIGTLAFYMLKPADVGGMLALTIFITIAYAPAIPLVWAIYADVADYSEWKNGRRATGVVFATIGFALKAGLSLGQSCFLWLMQAFYGYDPKVAPTPNTLEGFRMFTGIFVGLLFAICTILLMLYPLNKRLTIQISDELAQRRKSSSQTSLRGT